MIEEGTAELLGMLYLKKGKLSVSFLSEEGREVTLYTLEEGSLTFLFAKETIPSIHLDISLSPETDVELIGCPTSCLALLMRRNSDFAAYVHESLLRDFAHIAEIFRIYLFDSFDCRLASFLLKERMSQKSDTLSLTHEQIARHIGASREAVTRALKRFSAEGLLRPGRGQIILLHVAKLQKMTN